MNLPRSRTMRRTARFGRSGRLRSDALDKRALGQHVNGRRPRHVVRAVEAPRLLATASHSIRYPELPHPVYAFLVTHACPRTPGREGGPHRERSVLGASGHVELLAEQAQPHDECRKLVAHLNNEASYLFTFLLRPEVDATNWRGEQAIRPAVVNRKVWGGNQTWRGATTQGRTMSVLRHRQPEGVNAIDFLTRFFRAPDLVVTPLFS